MLDADEIVTEGRSHVWQVVKLFVFKFNILLTQVPGVVCLFKKFSEHSSVLVDLGFPFGKHNSCNISKLNK